MWWDPLGPAEDRAHHGFEFGGTRDPRRPLMSTFYPVRPPNIDYVGSPVRSPKAAAASGIRRATAFASSNHALNVLTFGLG
jgi:hypothetical protein